MVIAVSGQTLPQISQPVHPARTSSAIAHPRRFVRWVISRTFSGQKTTQRSQPLQRSSSMTTVARSLATVSLLTPANHRLCLGASGTEELNVERRPDNTREMWFVNELNREVIMFRDLRSASFRTWYLVPAKRTLGRSLGAPSGPPTPLLRY